MKELQRIAGGYPRDMNYMLDLQDELFTVTNGLFNSIPYDLVLSGCEVTDNQNGTVSIAEGLVYLNGKAIRFSGASNIPSNGSKAFLEGASVSSDPVTFEDQQQKNLYKEVKAIIGDASNDRQIKVLKELYTFKKYIDDVIASYGQKGETKWVIDLDGGFLDNFDASGLGVTPRWIGWALMNGNNGSPTMAGKSPKGVGSFVDDYGVEHTYANNQAGGKPTHKLSAGELPSVSLNYQKFVEKSNTWRSGGDSSPGNGTGGLVNATISFGAGYSHNIESSYRAGYWVIKIA